MSQGEESALPRCAVQRNPDPHQSMKTEIHCATQRQELPLNRMANRYLPRQVIDAACRSFVLRIRLRESQDCEDSRNRYSSHGGRRALGNAHKPRTNCVFPVTESVTLLETRDRK